MNVLLRERKQGKKGQKSLYLEFYKGTTTTPDGKTKILRDYEYLNLYLIDKPATVTERKANKDTLELAESIKNKRALEIKNGQYGFASDFKQKTNFIEYFQSLTDKRKESKGNYGNWDSAVKHLKTYCDANTTFKDIDSDFLEGFKEYLLNEPLTKSKTKLSQNAALSYFSKVKAAINQAFDDKIINDNPAKRVHGIKPEESKREYLTLDELKKVVKADCRYEVLKRAFLFSCLTGLRWSDIQKMKWSELQKYNEGWRLTFNQQKTKGLQYLDISAQAATYLSKPGKPDERVFIGLRYSDYMNVEITKWMLKAGITKDITFHCGRHTFAVLQLEMDTDIFTVSKLLGHSDLRTTQIYAKIMDEKKREAVNKIPDLNI